MQRKFRRGERVSHHGQRWLHNGLQRDVSATSTFTWSLFTVTVLLVNLLLFVQDAVSAGVKHLGRKETSAKELPEICSQTSLSGIFCIYSRVQAGWLQTVRQ